MHKRYNAVDKKRTLTQIIFDTSLSELEALAACRYTVRRRSVVVLRRVIVLNRISESVSMIRGIL